MIRVFLSGRHARRCPLSYPALTPLFAGHVELTDQPSRADLYLFAHSLDLQEAPPDLVRDWRLRQRPVVLLSEEPFWDTIWTGRPLDRWLCLPTGLGDLPVIQLNHMTSTIFDFDEIPYYLLTNHRFPVAYRVLFRRNATRSLQDWQAGFQSRAVDVTFMFERRPEPFHDVGWPEAGLTGLAAWRTRLAEQQGMGRVERLGLRWQPGVPRQTLVDWHLDKLVRLDNRARSLAAIENTHHPLYITEKLFDAFACGSRPIYFAGPDHRIHRLGLPEASWLNLYGLDPETAAARIARPFADAGFWQAWSAAQTTLARLWGDPGAVMRERLRLRRAILAELTALLDGGGHDIPMARPDPEQEQP
ncbi:hypothetical protein [Paracoccus sp. (in: a-proteobacteria)]|uniref:hypothetical protein n=1 Tax=Paracoccus sp. TaxID=267 RepID=UPI003A8501D6